jgi:hypothetical protein
LIVVRCNEQSVRDSASGSLADASLVPHRAPLRWNSGEA